MLKNQRKDTYQSRGRSLQLPPSCRLIRVHRLGSLSAGDARCFTLTPSPSPTLWERGTAHSPSPALQERGTRG